MATKQIFHIIYLKEKRKTLVTRRFSVQTYHPWFFSNHHAFRLFSWMLLCLLLTLADSKLLGQQEVNVRGREIPITWQPSPGALAYEIQIRNANRRLILERRVNTNAINVSLDEGEYEVRVTVLNIFEKRAPWSPWSKFTVAKALKPIITHITPSTMIHRSETKTIALQGDNLLPRTQVQVKKQDQEQPVKEVKIINRSHANLQIDLSDFAIGDYDLYLQNPGGQTTFIRNAFAILAPPPPTPPTPAVKRLYGIQLTPMLPLITSYPDLRYQYGIQFDTTLYDFNIFFFEPVMRFGYLKSHHETDKISVDIQNFRLNAILQVPFYRQARFSLAAQSGLGASIIRLEAHAKNSLLSQQGFSVQGQHLQLDFLLALKASYRINNQIHAFALIEQTNLFDGQSYLGITALGLGAEYLFSW